MINDSLNKVLSRRSINLDISYRCTLNCKGCMRYRYKELGLKIPGGDLSLENFKKILDWFDHIIFCGQISDPVMHPKFIEFLKLVKIQNKQASIHTAVSHKPISWYEKAFEANKPEYEWIFGLDGLPNESHQYRTNQNGEKLFEIMKFAVSKNVKVIWQYIVFDYNENHTEEAKQIANDNGMIFLEMHTSRWNSVANKYKPSKKFVDITSSSTLEPKCILEEKDLGHSTQGYLLPCCWCEPSNVATSSKNKKNMEEVDFLFQEKLKLDNINCIEDIILSDEWLSFFNTLINDPDNAPGVCKRYCKDASYSHRRIFSTPMKKK